MTLQLCNIDFLTKTILTFRKTFLPLQGKTRT